MDIKKISPNLFFLYYILFQQWGLAGLHIFNVYLNKFLKNQIFKPLMGTDGKEYPILGRGSRPDNAVDCGCWGTSNGKLATGYGMPSCHAQLAALFALSVMANKNLNCHLQTALVIFSLIIMYDRVHIGCHTPQQVVVGALIGSLTFFLYQKKK